jgi:hypothetical protein
MDSQTNNGCRQVAALVGRVASRMVVARPRAGARRIADGSREDRRYGVSPQIFAERIEWSTVKVPTHGVGGCEAFAGCAKEYLTGSMNRLVERLGRDIWRWNCYKAVTSAWGRYQLTGWIVGSGYRERNR